MKEAGQQLRAMREALGLTVRDVEAASARLAARHHSEEFTIQISRLSDIETKGILPSIYRLYTLAVIYRRDIGELLALYDIDLRGFTADLAISEPPRSHLVGGLARAAAAVRMPVRLDPAFNLARTTNIGRMVERWGMVPVSFLAVFENTDYSYGYIGLQDLTMYPLLMPGSFVQIDESKNKVRMGVWRSEYERPIYFVETRCGFACAWCSVEGDRLALHPYPLSPQKLRLLKYPQEAEVLGQVVAVAMRLGDWRPLEQPPAHGAPRLSS